MEKSRKIRRKVKGQGLHNSLDGYLTSLKEASIVTNIPDSNTVVIHLPKHVKELVFIDRKELDKFLSNITKLIERVTEITTSLASLALEEEEDGTE